MAWFKRSICRDSDSRVFITIGAKYCKKLRIIGALTRAVESPMLTDGYISPATARFVSLIIDEDEKILHREQHNAIQALRLEVHKLAPRLPNLDLSKCPKSDVGMLSVPLAAC